MIKVSVMYPNSEGSEFDMDYYCNTHVPMVREKLGTDLKKVSAEEGLGGAVPGEKASYIAMGHLYFDSVQIFYAAFAPHAEAIMGDIPNYTNVQPTVQVSEVKI